MLHTRTVLITVAVLAAGALTLGLIGCGGGSSTTITGGTITGQTVDAIGGGSLGGVVVSVTKSGVTYSDTSDFPGGMFTIEGLPDGVYAELTVTPPDGLFGGTRQVLLAAPIVISGANDASLAGPVLIVDGTPPDPPL